VTADHPFDYDNCRCEYLHEDAHQCAVEGCEERMEDHPAGWPSKEEPR
jgi:hypothetical protein